MEPLSGGSRSPSDRGDRSAKKFFSALGASFWSKNKGGPPLDPPLALLRVFDTLQYFEAILPSLKSP